MRSADTYRPVARLTCMMKRCGLLVLAAAATAAAQPSPRLQLKNVKSETVTYKGKACLRLTDVDLNAPDGARLAIVGGTDFADGTIELELAGDTVPDAPPAMRGFTGIAFRVADGGAAYESFYLRPRNGRAEDQEQRNHSAQYVSFPDFPWQRLRQQSPSKYESYVDLVPGEWTRMKVEVHGVKARLFVNGSNQPALIVNDLKRGSSHGSVAYWIGPGTVAHFADLRIGKE
ncbi:MAG TPA: hypothetical protein VGS58_15310 [Candidatus Sulfopaludibacter sp.]|nr:hypothetical protein [Candidatus Sulfopaludibacter sp.]